MHGSVRVFIFVLVKPVQTKRDKEGDNKGEDGGNDSERTEGMLKKRRFMSVEVMKGRQTLENGQRGFTQQFLVCSQVHRSVRWEHSLYTCSNQLASPTCLTHKPTHTLTKARGETWQWAGGCGRLTADGNLSLRCGVGLSLHLLCSSLYRENWQICVYHQFAVHFLMFKRNMKLAINVSSNPVWYLLVRLHSIEKSFNEMPDQVVEHLEFYGCITCCCSLTISWLKEIY